MRIVRKHQEAVAIVFWRPHRYASRSGRPLVPRRTCLTQRGACTLLGMIRSELVARIAAINPYLFARDVEAVVDAILDRIGDALAAGDRVELRDFGMFSVRGHEARASRNPRTGAVIAVPARTHVHFKPSKAMRTRLNLEKVDPDQKAERILRAS